MPAVLQTPHFVDLALGEHLGDHFVDVCLPADRVRRLPIVTGEENDIELHPRERLDRCHRRRPNRIGDGDEAKKRVSGDVDNRARLRRKL